jgi:hypothetical protein
VSCDGFSPSKASLVADEVVITRVPNTRRDVDPSTEVASEWPSSHVESMSSVALRIQRGSIILVVPREST